MSRVARGNPHGRYSIAVRNNPVPGESHDCLDQNAANRANASRDEMRNPKNENRLSGPQSYFRISFILFAVTGGGRFWLCV